MKHRTASVHSDYREIPRMLLICALLFFVAPPIAAHHSPAVYDVADETFELEGVIKEVEFRNPHSQLVLIVEGPDGQNQQWEVEFSSVNLLARRGWELDRLNVGDRVTCIGNPGKGGRHKMYMWSVELADGTVFKKE